MRTGIRGTFVISWSQTEVDGLVASPPETLSVGASWSWHGDPVRVDGPGELLQLQRGADEANFRKGAARMVRRLVGAALANTTRLDTIEVDHPLRDSSFVVTNGSRSWTITVIEVGNAAPPLLMFLDDMPPQKEDLWVVHHTLAAKPGRVDGEGTGGVICFTTGTRILTPHGAKLVDHLREGDWVQTKDNGAQQIHWIGSRRMTGARLFAMPKLRPIRIKAGALGLERPDEELLVSPAHRMLIKGSVAQALFNTPEVLVTAKDLINDNTVVLDVAAREVTYIHLMLPRHEIVFANGVETESFHPANTALSTITDEDRERLLAGLPEVEDNPHTYGAYARRNLTASEAAILLHEAA